MRRLTTKSLLVSLVVTLFVSCSDFPSEFVAPVFNTGLSIPLADTVISLNSLLTDTTFLKRNQSGGNYAIVQSFDLPTIRLGDSLSLNSVSFSYSTTFNQQQELLAQYQKWNTMTLSVARFDSTLPRSGAIQFNPLESEANVPLEMQNGVEDVSFKTGKLCIRAQNYLPIDVEIVTPKGYTTPGIVVVTPGEKQLFIPLNNDQRIIRKQQSRGDVHDIGGELSVDLAGHRISKSTVIKMKVRSDGSGNSAVAYNEANTFNLGFKITDVSLHSTKATIPQKELTFNNNAELPKDVKITQATVKDFAGKIDITNDFPLSGQATLVMPQLINARTNKEFVYSFRIEKRGVQTISISNNGDTYYLTPDAFDKQNGGAITALRMNCTVKTDAPTTAETFTETDVLSIKGVISPIHFSSAQGLGGAQKEITINTLANLNTNALPDVYFGSFTFKNIIIEGKINNGSSVAGVFNGKVALLDKFGSVLTEIPLAVRTITASNNNVISYTLSDVTLTAMPSTAKLNATIKTLNGETFTISENSSISGNVTITLPLVMSVLGGEFTTSDNLSFSNEILVRKDNINSIDVLLEAKNRIPVSLSTRVHFYNANGEVALSLPKENTMEIPGSSSEVPEHSFTRLSVDSSDVYKILSAKRYSVISRFNTSNNQIQKFTSQDYTHIKLNLECKANTK
ncbi:MAG: hypothetical protein JNJ85_16335 [Candidatus Kapabacteria bacterium]|nr:hypothetical protein [Candidatus Kapabacteria bacterium]